MQIYKYKINSKRQKHEESQILRIKKTFVKSIKIHDFREFLKFLNFEFSVCGTGNGHNKTYSAEA